MFIAYKLRVYHYGLISGHVLIAYKPELTSRSLYKACTNSYKLEFSSVSL